MNARASRLLLTGFVAVLLGMSSKAIAETIVIANEDVGASEINKRELQKVFLGRTSELAGQRVILATLRGGSSHKQFTEGFLRMTPQQFANHWRKIVFSGTGREPRSFESETDLVSFVSETPGAIGYISGSTLPSGVKQLEVQIVSEK